MAGARRDQAINQWLAEARGGRNQRLAQFEAGFGRGRATESIAANTLTELWAIGLISAPLIQVLADAFCREIAGVYNAVPTESMKRLARIGHFGIWTGNARRDLMRQCPLNKLLPKPTYIRTPYVDLDGPQHVPSFMDMPILLPNLMFEQLWQHFEHVFAKGLGPGLAQFWNGVRPDDPRLIRHPMLNVKERK